MGSSAGDRSGTEVLAAAALLAAACVLAASGAGARTNDRGFVAVPAPGTPASDEGRHALVIGNGRYPVAPLKNPSADAALVAASLRSVGFSVDERHDLDREQMLLAIRAFGERLEEGGVGVFYFAGHGMQVDGRSYLVPIGAQIAVEADVTLEAVDVGHVLARLEEAENRLNLVVLDACRNNPTARAWRSSDGGLAFMDAPTGTLIAYATAPGRTAADGLGEHSVYSLAFAEELRRPGLRVEQVFKRVRKRVREATRGHQVPWESSSLEGEFYFLREGQTAAPILGDGIPAHVASPNADGDDEAGQDELDEGEDPFRLGRAAEEEWTEEEIEERFGAQEREREVSVQYARLRRDLAWQEGRRAVAQYGTLSMCGAMLATCLVGGALTGAAYYISTSLRPAENSGLAAGAGCLGCSGFVCCAAAPPAALVGLGCGGWWLYEGENVEETTVELVRIDPHFRREPGDDRHRKGGEPAQGY